MLDTKLFSNNGAGRLGTQRQATGGQRCAVVCCAPGGTVLYPMAQVCLEVYKIYTATAISNSFPMAILLGIYVPELLALLNCRTLRNNVETSEAFVKTQTGSKRRAEEERTGQEGKIIRRSEAGTC